MCEIENEAFGPGKPKDQSTSYQPISMLCAASRVLEKLKLQRITLHQGVPQGSVLSPQLFNLYVSTYPETSEFCTSYADGFTASNSYPGVEIAADNLANYVADVAAWAEEKSIIVPTQKSTVTLFTPETKHSLLLPTVPPNGSPIPFDRNPKTFGVTFNPHFLFHKNVENIASKAKQRLNKPT